MMQYKMYMKNVVPSDPLNYKDILTVQSADVQYIQNTQNKKKPIG